MRKVTLGLANSLDNYIARKDGGFDWIHWSNEVAEISAKFMKTVDVLLIGRKTYDGMLAYGQTSYPGAKNYVFTRTKKKSAALKKKLAKADKNVEIISEDAAKFVKKLKSKKGDLIDEVVLNIHPVLLGSGIPLFHEMKRQINLELLDCRILKGGYLAVSYRIKH